MDTPSIKFKSTLSLSTSDLKKPSIVDSTKSSILFSRPRTVLNSSSTVKNGDALHPSNALLSNTTQKAYRCSDILSPCDGRTDGNEKCCKCGGLRGCFILGEKKKKV